MESYKRNKNRAREEKIPRKIFFCKLPFSRDLKPTVIKKALKRHINVIKEIIPDAMVAISWKLGARNMFRRMYRQNWLHWQSRREIGCG